MTVLDGATTEVPDDDAASDDDGIVRSGTDLSDRDGESRRGFLDRWGCELAVAAAALVLYAWGLSKNGYGNAYYAGSVRAMNTDITNFVFGSYDKGGWVTVDKPPMSQWMGAASARLFGFSSWSLLLPSVLCGVAAVWLVMATVRRPWGRAAGLVAGGVLALTPIMVAVGRSNNPDVLLVLWCVATAWAVQRGIGDGRLRWMLLAGVFAGLGFLTKSLEVGPVLPGLWLAYLVAAPGPFFRKRLWHCLAGGVVFLAVGASWIGIVDLTPLSSRPWIGGSSDGSAQDLVFGYNGIGRITGSGGGQMSSGGIGGALTGAGGIDEFGGATGIGRLFNAGMGDQTMWIAPVALVAAIAGLVAASRGRRQDERLGSLILWLGWALPVWLIFSFASGTFHNYYVALLSPALAALVGVGFQLARESGRVGRVVAALTLGATAVLEVALLRRVDAWHVLRIVVPVGVAIVLVAVLVTVVLRRANGRITFGALVAGLGLLLLAPGAWALSGVQHPQDPSFPDARPEVAGAPAGTMSMVNSQGLPEDEVAWLRAQRHGEKWIVAAGSVMPIETNVPNGDSMVALGGFIGSDPAGSVDRVADAVQRGDLRFILAGGGMSFGSASGSSAAVAKACTVVDPASWGGSAAADSSAGGSGTLYDCLGKADGIRANRDATAVSPAGTAPGGLPGGGGIPTDITPAQMQFGQCVLQHGGNLQELIAAAGGGDLPDDLRSAVDACGGLPTEAGSTGPAPAPTTPAQ